MSVLLRSLQAVLICSVIVLAAAGASALPGHHGASGANGPASGPVELPRDDSGKGATSLSGNDNDILLKIDGIPYTRKDVTFYVSYILGEDPEGKGRLRPFINELVVDVLGYEDAVAEMTSLETDPHVVSETRKFYFRLLPDRLLKAVREEVKYTAEDFKKTLPDPKPAYEVSVITSGDKEKTEAALAAVKAGMPFDEAARKYSDGFTAELGGKIQRIEEGTYLRFTKEEFENILPLKPGGVSDPFKTRIGWVVARLDRYLTPAELRDEQVEKSYPAARDKEEEKAVENLMKRLHEAADLKWDDPGLNRFREGLQKGQEMPEEFEGAPVVKVNGEPIFFLELSAMKNVHSPESLDIWLDKRIGRELAVQEALRRGLGNDLGSHLALAKKRAITRRYFAKKFLAQKVTDEEISAYYRNNKEKFVAEERRLLYAIETKDKKKAGEAAKKARKGEDFRTLASRYNDSEEKRNGKGEVGYMGKRQMTPDVASKVFSVSRGAIVGPLTTKSPGGEAYYVVIQVADVKKRRQVPLGEVDRKLIVSRILAGKMEVFYSGLLGKAQKDHKIESFIDSRGKGADSDVVA